MWLLPREILLAATIVASIIILLVVGYLLTDGKWESLKERENAAIFLAILAILITVNLQVGKIGLKRLVNLLQKSEAASETMIEKYEKHTLELTEKLDTRHNEINSTDEFPYLFDWWHTLELFELWKEYLQHLITGKRDFYETMLEIFGSEGKG